MLAGGAHLVGGGELPGPVRRPWPRSCSGSSPPWSRPGGAASPCRSSCSPGSRRCCTPCSRCWQRRPPAPGGGAPPGTAHGPSSGVPARPLARRAARRRVRPWDGPGRVRPGHVGRARRRHPRHRLAARPWRGVAAARGRGRGHGGRPGAGTAAPGPDRRRPDRVRGPFPDRARPARRRASRTTGGVRRSTPASRARPRRAPARDRVRRRQRVRPRGARLDRVDLPLPRPGGARAAPVPWCASSPRRTATTPSCGAGPHDGGCCVSACAGRSARWGGPSGDARLRQRWCAVRPGLRRPG